MANATEIDASGFTASFTRIDVVSGRRMQGASTSISTQHCDTTQNLAFVSVVFSSANYTLIESVVNAIKDRSGILHNILNSEGHTLAECAEVEYVLKRPINSAPPNTAIEPPPSPPLRIHFDNFLAVLVFGVFIFAMSNFCIISSRSKQSGEILNDLVESENQGQKKVVGGEELPLLVPVKR